MRTYRRAIPNAKKASFLRRRETLSYFRLALLAQDGVHEPVKIRFMKVYTGSAPLWLSGAGIYETRLGKAETDAQKPPENPSLSPGVEIPPAGCYYLISKVTCHQDSAGEAEICKSREFSPLEYCEKPTAIVAANTIFISVVFQEYFCRKLPSIAFPSPSF